MDKQMLDNEGFNSAASNQYPDSPDKKKSQGWQGGIAGYENCFNNQLTPMISRMRLFK